MFFVSVKTMTSVGSLYYWMTVKAALICKHRFYYIKHLPRFVL